MDHVARADLSSRFLRIVGMRRVFHRIEVIEVAEELVEAVERSAGTHCDRQMVLAELTGGVALRFEAVAMVQASAGSPVVLRLADVVMPGAEWASWPVMKLARPPCSSPPRSSR
jgi:hypothetical protein